MKRQKRKQKLEEKQRKAEEKAEIIKAFKHSKQLLLEAQLKKMAEAKEEEDDDDSYLVCHKFILFYLKPKIILFFRILG